jgi:4-hydroxythreonine-4-phosphate dehydrogenase
MAVKLPRIVITSGEPAGIGPDLCAMLISQNFAADITVLCDKNVFEERTKTRSKMHESTLDALRASIHAPSSASPFISTSKNPIQLEHLPTISPVIAGQLNAKNSRYVLNQIDRAIDGCVSGEFDAMVTAPVHKGVINDAGIEFTGHTEYLAERTKTLHVVMMLVGGGMKVALATIHIALKDVPAAVTKANLEQTIRVLHADLIAKFGIKNPHILVAGLNPHAGEDGYLGREEIDIINPVLAELRLENMHLSGALPADTLFAKHHLATADAVLAMYHDQGLPVLKHASFGGGVNVTLGLPIIRTSVDHGTALDLAGTDKINSGSMLAAIELAIELANNKPQ